jgi:hypothetical protein
MSFLHGPFWARWKADERGVELPMGNWMLPLASGSGKFGTQFARMHLANARSCWSTLAGTDGGGAWWGPYRLQACCALW